MRNFLPNQRNWFWKSFKSTFLGIILIAFSTATYGQYTPIYVQNGGYPGGVITTGITSTVGWTQIVPPSAATNQWSSSNALPFAFDFYGTPVTSFKVSSNGLLTFDPTATGAAPGPNTALPSAGVPDMTIASYWDDFTTSPPVGTNDAVWVSTFGTAPNRQFMIKWFSHEWAALSFAYVGIILEESTNIVYTLDLYTTTPTGSSTTVGLQQNSTTATFVGDNIPFAGNTGAGIPQIDYYTFYPPGFCINPSNASTINLSANSATGVWNSNGPGTSFQLELGLSGFTPGTGIMVSTTDTFYNATGLTSNTAYQWYVREICGAGDTSLWTGPISFSTFLDPISNPSVCGLGLALPDNNSIVIPINVTGAGTALGNDVILTNVNFIIQHTFRGDVDLFLRSPNGVLVELTTDNGSSGDNYGDSAAGCTGVFNLNMYAPSAVTSFGFSSPAIGSYVPEGNFASFNDGSSPNGLWTLEYADDAGGDVGTLQYIELEFAAPPLNSPSACGLALGLPDNNDPNFQNIGIITNTTVGTQLGVDVVVSEVNFIMNHTWRADVIMNLVSPSGNTVSLISRRGGSGDHFGDTVGGCVNVFSLSSNVSTPLSSFVTASSGNASYAPEGNYSTFNDGSNPNGLWTLQYQDEFGGDVGTLQFIEIVFSAPACLFPLNLSTINITTSSATGVWSSQGGPATSFEVEYGAAGFTLGTGVMASVIDTFVNVSGLSANTSYDWYVREICGAGDTSIWSGPSTFSTPCGTYTAPFAELFDGAAWSMTGTFDIDACWSKTPQNTGAFWRTEDFQTGSGSTGPAGDVSGTGKYVYYETSLGAAGDTGNLVSPIIDVSALTNPQAEFYYHMYGATIGTAIFEMNDGGTWTTLWSLSGSQQTSVNDPWVKVIVPLTVVGPNVQFRFRAVRGTSFTGDIAIDEFRVRQSPTNELSLIDLSVPTSGCGLSSSETVTLTILNQAAGNQTGFPVSFQVAGQAVVTETVAATINSGDTLVYTFTAGADLSATGPYSVLAYVDLSNDEDRSNDSLTVNGVNSPVVSAFPYTQDFESGQGDWNVSGANTTWQHGTPANTVINSAASGTNAWVTNLTGNYAANEAGVVESPCFDFSGLIDPAISLNIFKQSENSWDGAVIQVSTDAGNTWSQLGNVGDPVNWYNDNSIAGLASFGSQDGWTGEIDTAWVNASHLVNGTGGSANVKFRVAFGSDGSVQTEGFGFDDINIYETALTTDMSVASIDGLSSGCGLSSTTTIQATLVNTGLVGQSGFGVSYVINGGSPVNETVAATINAGDTLQYSFTTTADLSAAQVYNIDVYSSLAGDLDNSNDSTSTSVESFVVPVLTTNSVTICGPQNVTLIGSTTAGQILWTDLIGNVVAVGDSFDLGLVSTSQSYIAEAATTTSDTLSTTFAGGNGQAGNMFNIIPVNNIIVDSFDIHVDVTTPVVALVHYKLGTYVGAETDPTQWTFVDSMTVTGNGVGIPTRLPIGNIPMASGQTYGVWVTLTTTNIDYTTLGAITTYSNSDLDIVVGAGVTYPLGGGNFSPRGFNGRVHYSVAGCTSGPQQVDVNFGVTPNATFSWSQTAPLTLTFAETVVPNADSVSWDFGDANSSNASNPTHAYAAAGSYTVCMTAYINGCDTTVCEGVFTTVGLADKLSDALSIYPNPSSGSIVIQTDELKVNGVEVLDMLGNVVYTEEVTFNKQKTLELGFLTSGNYVLKLRTNEGSAVKRFTITK